MSDAAAISTPFEPGGFVGDIYFGHPFNSTMGTHRWSGSEWVALPSVVETLAGLLVDARAERDSYRKALEGLMAHEPDYSDTLWQDARAALEGESHE